MLAHCIARANSEIGVGHILRTLEIARLLRERGVSVQAVAPEDSLTAQYCRDSDVAVLPLEAEEDQWQWSSYLAGIGANPPDILWLDLLEPDLRRFELLRNRSPHAPYVASLSSFPYTLRRFEDVTVYPCMDSPVGLVSPENTATTFLVGPDYFIFRREFLDAPGKTFSRDTRRLLITMGGADPHGFTSLVVEALESVREPIECRLILGRAARPDPELNESVARSHHDYTVICESPHIATLMAWADVAVINGGMTRYELALVGTPFVAISLDDRQYSITQKMSSLGMGQNLGVGDTLDVQTIGASIDSMLGNLERRKEMSRVMKRAFDGLGAQRITQYILDAVVKHRSLSELSRIPSGSE